MLKINDEAEIKRQNSEILPPSDSAFFKHDFSDLFSSGYFQIIDASLSANELLARFYKLKRDDEQLLTYLPVIILRFITTYTGRVRTKSEPLYGSFFESLLSRAACSERNAAGDVLFRWIYSYFFAFANFLEQTERNKAPCLKTMTDFLLDTAKYNPDIFAGLIKYAVAFPENVPPPIYKAIFKLLLEQKTAGENSRQALESIYCFFNQTLIDNEIDPDKINMLRFPRSGSLNFIAASRLPDKNNRRLLQAACIFEELEGGLNRIYEWYPENLIEMFIKQKFHGVPAFLENAQTLTSSLADKAILAGFDTAICRNAATDDNWREKLFQRRREQKCNQEAWEILATSPVLAEKVLPLLTDEEIVDAFIFRLVKYHEHFIGEDGKQRRTPVSQKFYIRAMRLINQSGHHDFFRCIHHYLSSARELSLCPDSPEVIEEVLWEFRAHSDTVDRELAACFWTGEERNEYFARHRSREVIKHYYLQGEGITEAIFKRALLAPQRCGWIIQNPLWLNYLGNYFGLGVAVMPESA